MFKVNNKDTIKTHWAYFTPCSRVSIVNFEQVNAGWVAFFILRIIELFISKVCIFLISYFLTCSIVSVCLWINISFISGECNSERKCCYNAKPSAYYFFAKAKIPVDLQICISVPLRLQIKILKSLRTSLENSFWA